MNFNNTVIMQEILDKTSWNKLISSQKMSQFLQSWEWGEFQKSLNREIWRLDCGAQIFKHKLLFKKNYLYIPRILINNQDNFFEEIKKIAKQEKSIFIRIESVEKINFNLIPIKQVQPVNTLILDLQKPEEELLKSMHHKTRYNIRLAERKNIQIKKIENKKIGIENFLKLNKETTDRDQFVSHGDNYYRKMIESDIVELWQAEYQGEILASNIVIVFGDMATYLHGASSSTNRNLMAPHLLQWKIIQNTKSRGFKFYDFWGINPENQDDKNYKKSWQGITRFKKGFGGEIINYPGCFDLIIDKFWYLMYSFGKFIGN